MNVRKIELLFMWFVNLGVSRIWCLMQKSIYKTFPLKWGIICIKLNNLRCAKRKVLFIIIWCFPKRIKKNLIINVCFQLKFYTLIASLMTFDTSMIDFFIIIIFFTVGHVSRRFIFTKNVIRWKMVKQAKLL